MSKSDDIRTSLIEASIAELEAVLAKATDEYHRAVLEQAIDQRRGMLIKAALDSYRGIATDKSKQAQVGLIDQDLSGGQAPATLATQAEFAGGQTS